MPRVHFQSLHFELFSHYNSGNFFLYLLLALYVDTVRYMGRPWYFFVTPTYWRGKPIRKHTIADVGFLHWKLLFNSLSDCFQSKNNDYEIEMDKLDTDVLAEKDMVSKAFGTDDKSVIISNLTKTYYAYTCGCVKDKKNSFRAVKGVDVTMLQGLLPPL